MHKYDVYKQAQVKRKESTGMMMEQEKSMVKWARKAKKKEEDSTY